MLFVIVLQLLHLSSGFKLVWNCTAEGCGDRIDYVDAAPALNATTAQSGKTSEISVSNTANATQHNATLLIVEANSSIESATNRNPSFIDKRSLRGNVITNLANGEPFTNDALQSSTNGTGAQGEILFEPTVVQKIQGKSVGVFGAFIDKTGERQRSMAEATSVLVPLGTCFIAPFHLHVSCASGVFSFYSNQLTGVTLAIDGSPEEVGLQSRKAVVFVYSAKESRWILHEGARKLKELSRSNIPAPLFRIKAGNSVCHFRGECSPLPPHHKIVVPAGDRCSPSAALHMGAAVARDGAIIGEADKVSLGEKLSLRIVVETRIDEFMCGNSTKAFKKGTFLTEGPADMKLDMHINRCWVGNETNSKATLVQHDRSIVSIMKNFTSHRENGSSIFLYQFPVATRAPTLIDELLKIDKLETDFVLNNNSAQPETKETTNSWISDSERSKSSRISMDAEFIGFVMDMQDKIVEISCDVKVCIGGCGTGALSLEDASNTPAIFSQSRLLTVAFHPITSEEEAVDISNKTRILLVNKTVISTARHRRQKRSSFQDSDTGEVSTDAGADEISRPESSAESLISDANAPVVLNVNKSEDASSASKYLDGMQTCVPLWLLLVVVASLSFMFCVILSAFVYFPKDNNKKYQDELSYRIKEDPFITPDKPLFPRMDTSARKRSPPIWTDLI